MIVLHCIHEEICLTIKDVGKQHLDVVCGLQFSGLISPTCTSTLD